VARAHLQARVHELDEEARELLVSHAITRLPADSRQHSDDKIAAVILLGVLAFVHKRALDKPNACRVARDSFGCFSFFGFRSSVMLG
jgi:hypothetical protein